MSSSAGGDEVFDVVLSLEAVSAENFARVFSSLSAVASGYAMDGFNVSIESSPTFSSIFVRDSDDEDAESGLDEI